MRNPNLIYTPLRLLAKDDQPREKLATKGRAALSNAEIIGILIGSGTKEKSAVQLSREILSSVGNNLDDLAKLNIHELQKFHGIGIAKAVTIAAALELGRRRQATAPKKINVIRSSRDIYLNVKEHFKDLQHEEFYIVLLNQANRVISTEIISRGGISGTAVDGKVIFKKAIEQSASAIVLCHNHPSGNLQPSNADLKITSDLKNFGEMIQLRVIDHLIVAGEGYFSFKDEGIL